MNTSDRARPGRQQAQGFALILAILSLMLLTILGLSLAATTTTEIQIATNYKWSQQALANAEAGLEIGRRVLRNMDWSSILPQARTGTWLPDAAPTPPAPSFTGASRNWENKDCDRYGGVGYGAVLNDGTVIYENVSAIPNTTIFPATVGGVSTRIHGAFTLWIKRPVILDAAGGRFGDSGDPLSLVLTSEGTAPYTPPLSTAAGARFVSANRAVRVMEMRLTQEPMGPCGGRSGQQALGQSGANFAACVTMGPEGLADALTGAAGARAATITDRGVN